MSFIDTATSLIIARVDAYLSDTGRGGSLRAFPSLKAAVSRLTNEALKEWAEISGSKDRYLCALNLLENDTVLQTLMELCITEYICPEFSAYIKQNFDCDICLHVAALIEGRDRLSFEETSRDARLAGRLLITDPEVEPVQYARFMADERLIGFLSGDDVINRKLSGLARVFSKEDELHEPFVNRSLIKRGYNHLSGGGRVLCLAGRGGRRFIARHIARLAGSDFLFLDISDLIRRAGSSGLPSLKDTLIREAYLRSAGICLYGFDERFITGGSQDTERGRRDMGTLSGMLFTPIADEGIKLILCVDDLRLFPGRESIEGLKILRMPETYDLEERKSLWKGLFGLYGLSLDPASFAVRYRMEPKEAAQAVLSYTGELEDEAGRSAEEDKARPEKSAEEPPPECPFR